MSRAVLLESQIRSILEVLSKAAVAEISQLLQEDSVILQLEIRSREEEIEALKKRLHFTQKELKKAQTPAHTCSVGVQVQMLDSDVMDGGMGSLPEINHQSCNTSSIQELKEEKPQLPDTMIPSSRHVAEEPSAAPEPGEPQDQLCSEGGFGGLEFEMKIEQVEELVDQELRLPRADYRTDHPDSESQHKTDRRDVQLWPPVEEDTGSDFGVSELEQYQQIPTEPCVEPVFKVPQTSPPENMTSKPTDCFGSAMVKMEREVTYEGGTSTSDVQNRQQGNTISHVSSQRQGQSSAHSLPNSNRKRRLSFGSFPRPHAHLPTNTPSSSHMISPGIRATVSHEPKPFRCEECGKGFTEKKRLVTHRRSHTGDLMDSGKGSSFGSHWTLNTSLVQEHQEEQPQLRHKSATPSQQISQEPSSGQDCKPESNRLHERRSDEEFGGLEFEMKIEQVEELVDQELGHPDSESEHKTDQRVQMCPQVKGSDSGVSELVHSQQIPKEPCVEPVFKVPQTSPSENMTNKPTDPFGSGPARTEGEVTKSGNYEGGARNCAQYGQLGNTVSHVTSRRQGQSSAHLLACASTESRQSLGSVSHLHIDSPTNSPSPATHASSKLFRCEECGKVFTQKTRLRTHKWIHTGQKPYYCLCGKGFSRHDSYLRHMRVHSREKR